MVRRKSQSITQFDIQVNKAVLRVQSGKYKSIYKAIKQLGLLKSIIIYYINRDLSYS
jgi:hypothetical protein